MLPVVIEKIDDCAIRALLDNKVEEQRSLDYKRDLPKFDDEGKRELLADVSSLANADGGDLVFGIEEDKGIPVAIRGVVTDDTDKLILRLEEIIRTGIQPRIGNISTRAVQGFERGPVIVIRIPRSWAAPHMVTFGNLSRFYSRNSKGKFQLDVGELRGAFSLSGTLAESIKKFRSERIATIQDGGTPLQMPGVGKIVGHIVPAAAFYPGFNIELKNIRHHLDLIESIGSHCVQSTFNVDGYVRFSQADGEHCGDYTQVFRNGIIESVLAQETRRTNSTIASISYEEDLIEWTKSVFKAYNAWHQSAIFPPAYVRGNEGLLSRRTTKPSQSTSSTWKGNRRVSRYHDGRVP